MRKTLPSLHPPLIFRDEIVHVAVVFWFSFLCLDPVERVLEALEEERGGSNNHILSWTCAIPYAYYILSFTVLSLPVPISLRLQYPQLSNIYDTLSSHKIERGNSCILARFSLRGRDR